MYKCNVCGWVYEEAEGCSDCEIASNTQWTDVPDDFVCPLCGASKSMFAYVAEEK